MRNLLSILLTAAAALCFVADAAATPPHYIDVREVLVGANDSLFVVQEYVFDNLGSHFQRTEALSVVVYRSIDRTEVERRLVRELEYSLDASGEGDGTTVEITRRAGEPVDIASLLDRYDMSLAFERRWPVLSLTEAPAGIIVSEGERLQVEVASRSEIRDIFSPLGSDLEEVIDDATTYSITGAHFVGGSSYLFVVVRLGYRDDPESRVRIMPISRDLIAQRIEEVGPDR